MLRTLPTLALLGLPALALSLVGACTENRIRGGSVSRLQADQYKRDAVRMSNEGVVLEPLDRAAHQYDRLRLNEIAQELRGPAAVCFVERAIQTMEPGTIDGEPGWVDVPEGQARIRAHVSVDGSVLSTDLLESGFTDEVMVECLRKAISKLRFPQSRDSFAHNVDIFYWVSLGFFRAAQTEEFAELMRKQQALAGVEAKNCLTGRVGPGEYPVSGLNLFDRDGRTVINRIDPGPLPPEVATCIATAFRAIRIPPESEAFVRPATPSVVFTVAADGSVSISDERWLELVLLEEEAAREARKAELEGRPPGKAPEEPDMLELPEHPIDELPLDRPSDSKSPEETADEPPVDVPPAKDPGNNTKIDFSPRRNR